MNKLSGNEVRRILETVDYLGTVTPGVVEKDIFVTRAIHALAEMKHSDINLVFCGGTCLAKAHQIISRMSEDIDFKIFPDIPFTTQSEQRRKLRDFRNELTAFLQNAGFEVSAQNFRSRDNNSYIVYNLDYPSQFDQHQQLKPHIQLEFTLAVPRLPTEIKSVATLIDRVFPEDGLIEKNINCISIFETAAEKWVGLTRRIAAIARGHDPLDETLVRHLYDLQTITNQVKLHDEFFSLITDTIERDRIKFKRHHEYIANPLAEINYSIKVLGHNPKWLANYNNFVEAMVFSKEKAKFEQCYEKLQAVTEQISTHLDLPLPTEV